MLLEQLRPSPSFLRVRARGRQCTPARALITLAACLTAGCTSFGELGHDTAVVNKSATATAILTDDLQLMQRLVKGSTSEKVETFAAAQHDCDTAPTATHKLRLALALATPGHPASNPIEAQHMLQELMVNPEGLVPGEQALAQVEMKQIDDYLSLQQKTERLSADASRADKQAAQIKRLQTEAEERLRELNEAKAKLEEITKIETSLSERGNRKPNSEGQPQ